MAKTRKRVPKKIRQQVKRSNRSRSRQPRRGPSRVSAPVSAQAQNMTTAPIVTGGPFSSSGRTIVRHREYIAEVIGSTGFSVSTYPVNPGMLQTFPWLGRFPAQGYDMYHFRYIRFCYETEQSTASAGSIMMAFDYDASDSAPINKISLMSYNGAVRSSCWAPISIPGASSMINKVKTRFIRSGALAVNQDIKLYDTANFMLAIQGCTNGAVMGELYVEYEVELFSPQLDNVQLTLASSSKISNSNTTRTAPFTGTPTIAGGLPLTVTANKIAFPVPGSYLVYYTANGTTFSSGTTVGALFTATGDATISPVNSSLQVAAATFGDIVFVINTITTNDGFTVDVTTWCATLVSTIVRITPFPVSLA